MKTIVKIIITMFIDILKSLFTKGPIVKPTPTPTVEVDMNKTIIMSHEEMERMVGDNTPPIVKEPEPITTINLKPRVEDPEKPVDKFFEKEKLPMLVTKEQFLEIFPHGNVDIVDSINKILVIRGIITHERVAAFLAQCGHESAGFTHMVENLNYNGDALWRIFHTHFKDAAEAATFAHKQEAIANRVYSNRLGNGNEASGDGWKYRGHGAIQTTGKNAYIAFAKFCGKTLEETLDYITTNDGAIDSAAYYWLTALCNPPADKKDMDKLTEIINGHAKLGLAERKALFAKAYPIIAENFPKAA